MTQDEVFAKQAVNLAGTAIRALEEAYQYIEDIQDNILREKTKKEVEKIMELL